MASRILHMSATLDFLEQVIRDDERRGRSQVFVTDVEYGGPVNYVTALLTINKLREDGFEVFPPCDSIDETGRCRGHKEGEL